jgi:hypothetical protein
MLEELNIALAENSNGYANIQEAMGYTPTDLEQIGTVKSSVVKLVATSDHIDQTTQRLRDKTARHKVEYNHDINLLFFWMSKILENQYNLERLVEASTTLLMDVLSGGESETQDLLVSLNARRTVVSSITPPTGPMPEPPYSGSDTQAPPYHHHQSTIIPSTPGQDDEFFQDD